MLRNAQVFLRRKGLIELYDKKWRLVESKADKD